MCPAGGAGKESPSHGFAVPAPFRQGDQGGRGLRIATASVRTDLAMTEFPWSVVHGRRATARVAPTEGYKEYGGPGDRKGRPYPPIFPLYTFPPPGFLTSLTMISAPHAADLDTLLIFNIF